MIHESLVGIPSILVATQVQGPESGGDVTPQRPSLLLTSFQLQAPEGEGQRHSRGGSVVVDVWADGVCGVILEVTAILPRVTSHSTTARTTATAAVTNLTEPSHTPSHTSQFP